MSVISRPGKLLQFAACRALVCYPHFSARDLLGKNGYQRIRSPSYHGNICHEAGGMRYGTENALFDAC